MIADARTPIEALEERQGIRLRPDGDQEEVDTLGGLVSTLAGRVPKRGEVIAHPSGIEFEVLEADPRRIKRLRVRSLPAGERGSGRRQCLRRRCSAFEPAPGSTRRCAGWPQDVAALSGWRRYGLAFVLGVGAAAALPPFDLTPLLAVVFPGLLWLDDGSASLWASFRLGWVFGFGFFLAGLYWIAAALFVDIDRFWWLVPFAAAGLPAGFAVYVGLALLATSLVRQIPAFAGAGAGLRLCHRLERRPNGSRGHALTGLPWNLIGYAWSGGFPGALAVLQSVAWSASTGSAL